MNDIQLSMVDNIKNFVIQFKDYQNDLDINAYINYYQGLNVTSSFGVGHIGFVPFIAFLGKGEQTQQGIYPVILFYRQHNIVVLSYGISATKTPLHEWGKNAKTIGQFFEERNIKLTKLKNTERKYINSLIYKIYSIENLDYEQIVADLDDIIKEYKERLAFYGVLGDADFKAPPRSQNVKRVFFESKNLKWGNSSPKTNYEKSVPQKNFVKEPPMNVTPFAPLQKIFFGTPGGGKSHKVKTLIEEEHKAKTRMFRTTFHPDTDYASFVGSYKPVMKGNDIIYTYVPQVFTLAYVAAWNDPSHEYFLDIEEINRGNCAQIFGDLFQLLDRNEEGKSEYPVKADADLCDYLKNGMDKDDNDILRNKKGIENDELCLPANLSIVATMNTSDQSLFPMDSAFKRRWDWEFVPSKFYPEHNYDIVIGTGAKQKTYKWHDFLKVVNGKIKEATDSEDKQMGSFFVKTNLDEEKFKSKVMFYLWSEICKDEYKTQNNFFRYKDAEKNDQEFTFNELYEDGSTEILQKFMSFLEVKPVNGSEETPADTQETSADTQDE